MTKRPTFISRAGTGARKSLRYCRQGKRRFCLVGCCDENAAILYAMLFSNVIIYTWVAIFNSSEKRLQTEASEYDM